MSDDAPSPVKKQVNKQVRKTPARISGVSKTLFLPLYFRAMETRRADPIVVDDKAAELAECIDFDFSVFENDPLLQTAAMMRVREFDELVKARLDEHPRSVVVNLGCGLGTRFYRVDNGHVIWHELDLPPVIDLRRSFFEETDRHRCIAGSLFDTDWMETIAAPDPERLLFLAEGVLMYFKEARIRRLVENLKDRFPGCLFMFDALSYIQALMSYFNASMIAMRAGVQWALPNNRALEAWGSDITFIEERFYFDRPMPRPTWINMLRMFPHISRGFSIVTYRLGKGSKNGACGV